MWGLFRKVSTPGMFCALDSRSSVPVAYSLIRPKSKIFNIGHDYTLWIRNFMVTMKKPKPKIKNPLFWDLVQCPMAIIWPKSQNSNVSHDGILSIGNFMLMINNHFKLFQLPGILSKTKKMCSLFSWQHAISYLLFMNMNLNAAKIRVVISE
jgi:hypothetical protein